MKGTGFKAVSDGCLFACPDMGTGLKNGHYKNFINKTEKKGNTEIDKRKTKDRWSLPPVKLSEKGESV